MSYSECGANVEEDESWGLVIPFALYIARLVESSLVRL